MKKLRKQSRSFYKNTQKVPWHPLLEFEGFINGIPCRILKDDGASSNFISKEFWNTHQAKLPSKSHNISISHSSQGHQENACKVVDTAQLTLKGHLYESKFVVANTRYDVILGTPWHNDVLPKTNYKNGTIQIGEEKIHGEIIDNSEFKLQNISVKKFKRFASKKGTEIYAVVVNSLEALKFGKETTDPELLDILGEFKDVFRSSLPQELPPKRSVDHKIETNPEANIPNRGLYRLSPDELRATREYIAENLKNGRIRPSKSPYGAPLFFAKQAGKPLRGVVDYRMLNRITKRNRTPTPRSDEMFDVIGGSSYFTKIDLKTGFHQIRMSPNDIEKTAFQTKYGQFEYLVLPMGLCNAPATFTAMMNEVLQGYIDNFCTVYLDDILIFSNSKEDHRKHVRKVLERLKENKLYASPKKCYFMTQEVEFLGIIVSKNGLKVNPEKTSVIRNWPKPESISDIRSFLGLASFFRRFIEGFSELARPMTELTKKGRHISEWNVECDIALEKLKHALTSAPVLAHPKFELSYKGHIDASQFAIGGTLTQIHEGKERVISYFSRKLNDAQTNYTANDRELLGLIGFLTHFRCYLEGAEFEIYTDNQVLKHLFTKKDLSRKEARWLDLLSDFGIFPITLKKGKVHVLGDTLSRAKHETKVFELQNITTVQWDLTERKEFKADLKTDQVFQHVIENIGSDKKLQQRYYWDESTGILRLKTGELCIPRKFVKVVLEMVHDAPTAGHFGEAKTLERLRNFHWRRKAKDVKNYVKGCVECQKQKNGNSKALTTPEMLELPSRRWGSISTDFIVGLPETKNGFDSIITFVDRFSKRPHFLPCKSTDTAVEAAKLFIDNVFKHHGLPNSIVSDRDPKFTSNFWSELMKLLKIQLKMSTASHPQTDGQSEVANRIVEEYLRMYCNYRQNDWDEHLGTAEFAYSSSVFSATGLTPFYMDLGWEPKSPVDLIDENEESNVKSVEDLKLILEETFKDAQASYKYMREKQVNRLSRNYKPPDYKVGDFAMLKTKAFKDSYSKSQASSKLSARKIGPFEVTQLIGKNAIKLKFPPTVKIHPVINVSHTVPYHPQPKEFQKNVGDAPDPVLGEQGEEVYVDKILNHRKVRNRYSFLVLWKGQPTHEASWEPVGNFIDSDGTCNEQLLDYLNSNNLYDEVVIENGKAIVIHHKNKT